MLKFVKNLRKKGRPLQEIILFTKNELKEAENFFKKATLEVKKFAKPRDCKEN